MSCILILFKRKIIFHFLTRCAPFHPTEVTGITEITNMPCIRLDVVPMQKFRITSSGLGLYRQGDLSFGTTPGVAKIRIKGLKQHLN